MRYIDTLIALDPGLSYFSEGSGLHVVYQGAPSDLGDECSLARDDLLADAAEKISGPYVYAELAKIDPSIKNDPNQLQRAERKAERAGRLEAARSISRMVGERISRWKLPTKGTTARDLVAVRASVDGLIRSGEHGLAWRDEFPVGSSPSTAIAQARLGGLSTQQWARRYHFSGVGGGYVWR